MEDHELERLLGDAEAAVAPSADALAAVMARHRRGRVRVLGVALAVAVVAGPAVGVVIGRSSVHGTDHQVLVEASGDGTAGSGTQPDAGGTATSVHATLGALNGVAVSPSGPSLQRLFVRTTDGVTIRAYQTDLGPPTPPPSIPPSTAGPAPSCPPNATCAGPLPPECRPVAVLQAEMSNDAAVGSVGGELRQLDAQAPVAVVGDGFFGSREGDPVGWVAVHAGPGVARIRVRFSDGATDEMAPASGFAVLAHRLAPPPPPPPSPPSTLASGTPAPRIVYPPTPTGSAEALDGAGRATARVSLDGSTNLAPQCAPQPRIGASSSSVTIHLTPTTAG